MPASRPVPAATGRRTRPLGNGAGPWRSALRVTLPPWLAARALIGLVLALVWVNGFLEPAGEAPGASGLWVWDAGWYREIGAQGYGQDPDLLRFFPLVPLLGRGLSVLFGGRIDLALLALASVTSLVYGALLVRLVRLEVGDEQVARRTAWLGMLAPGAGVLVLAYTEPVAGALAVGFFLALRRDAPLAAVPLGLLSGLARPTGLLLAAPAALELWRATRAGRLAGPAGAASWVAAVLSPLAGTGLYCLWVGAVYGEPLAPYTIQTRRGLRGGVAADPRQHLFTTIHHGLDWRLQLALLLTAAALLVLVARRLPPAYAAWSALMLAAAVTSAEGHSMPRYVASTFPLLIGAALGSRGRRWWGVLLASAALFGYVAFRGFTPDYVL